MKLLLALFICFNLFANEDEALESKLEGLNVPSNETTPLVSEEQVYSIKERYRDLTYTSELNFSLGRDFEANKTLSTNMASAAYRFHLSNRWALKLGYTRVSNELSSHGVELLNKKELITDSDYLLNYQDFGVEFNVFYGKFKLTADKSQYFDTYVTAGVRQFRSRNAKNTLGPYLDLGIALWLGKYMSLRFGFDNSIYKAQTEFLTKNDHVLTGHLDIGVVFGGI